MIIRPEVGVTVGGASPEEGVVGFSLEVGVVAVKSNTCSRHWKHTSNWRTE